MIRIPVENLPAALKGACDLGIVQGVWRVTDLKTFAKEVAHALNDEDEQGTTPIHRMFDDAFNYVIEQGGEGIEDDTEKEENL